MPDTARPSPVDPRAALTPHRPWFIGLGVILLVLGGLAFLNLLVATAVSVDYVGILMVLGAAAQIAHAFRVRRWGGFTHWVSAGMLYGTAGILVLANPLLATTLLTLLIALSLLAAGVFRIMVTVRERPRRGWGWGWVLAAGGLSVTTGLVILSGWPVNSLWILGMFLAVDLILQGRAWLAVGQALDRR